MNNPKAPKAPKAHDFWIRSQGSDWHWLAFNGNDVAKYSGSLANQVKEDKQTASSRVQLCDGVSEDALKVIISSIPSQHDDGDLPALCINERDPESNFDELLSLAIACWKYGCAIPPMCKKFADEFYLYWIEPYGHEVYSGIPGRQTSKAINWMFVALVFKWGYIFTKTSRLVFSMYNTRDDNPNLPQDFQELVTQTRKRKVQQTYDFVQKSWMSFYEPSSDMLKIIYEHFQYRLEIELRSPLPKRTYKRINPDKFLIELAEVVQANEIQDPSLLSPPVVFDAPVHVPGPQTHGTGRGGLFGPAVVSFGLDMLHAAQKRMKPRAQDNRFLRSSSSSERSWEKMRSLERDINDFRTRTLQGISLQDERYARLRKEHIKPTISGFQPKIKRS